MSSSNSHAPGKESYSPQRANVLARVPLAWQHRGDLLTYEQRKKMNRYVRLAKKQGGLRCQGGYIVPCWYCGWWLPLAHATIEHLMNRRDGGTNWHENLVLSCYRCNHGRATMEDVARRRYGLKKKVRRRLRCFRMDVSAPKVIVRVIGDRLKLIPLDRRESPPSAKEEQA